MRRSSQLALFAFVVASLLRATAHADGPSAALDELKRGYALKQDGNCRDATPHFARSVQLDPTPKALLNLADCEARMGDLVAAQSHATLGRELARQQNDAELVGVADGQLAAIETRLPRLTIRLAPGAPLDSTVSRDGSAVAATSFGSPIGLNPGAHAITVNAPGYGERRFDVTVAEGAREQIEVRPGAKLSSGGAAGIAATPEQPTQDKAQTYKLLAYGALGIGAVGLTVGIATGFAAGSKHGVLEGECNGNNCPPTAQGDLDSFHALKTWSTVGYVVGAVGLAGGAALWLTAPKASSDSTGPRAWIGPTSAGVAGAF